jgi:hypothetical protein
MQLGGRGMRASASAARRRLPLEAKDGHENCLPGLFPMGALPSPQLRVLSDPIERCGGLCAQCIVDVRHASHCQAIVGRV